MMTQQKRAITMTITTTAITTAPSSEKENLAIYECMHTVILLHGHILLMPFSREGWQIWSVMQDLLN